MVLGDFFNFIEVIITFVLIALYIDYSFSKIRKIEEFSVNLFLQTFFALKVTILKLQFACYLVYQILAL